MHKIKKYSTVAAAAADMPMRMIIFKNAKGCHGAALPEELRMRRSLRCTVSFGCFGTVWVHFEVQYLLVGPSIRCFKVAQLNEKHEPKLA